jgi:hypothetical protein
MDFKPFSKETTYKNDLKKNTFDFVSISSRLEEALKSAKYRNPNPLDTYKYELIQSVILGQIIYDPITQRELEVLGLNDKEVQRLRKQALDFCRMVSPSKLDYQLVAYNLAKFFDFLNLRNLFPNGKLSIFSFGCAKAPEALALEKFFEEQLAEFKGFDKNQQLIEEAKREVNQRIGQDSRKKFSFFTQDLNEGLPEGNPNLIIIRHPNIFDPSDERYENPSRVWQKIFTEAREKYPDATILITTLTEEEAKACCRFLDLNDSLIKVNPHKTHFEIDFPNYGTFKLPVAADEHYILFSSN